jgi:hypothetical protein
LRKIRTDARERAVYIRRAKASRARGDLYAIKKEIIFVKFNEKFDIFVSKVALKFRPVLYYEEDNGRHARGLVQASGDLWAIHQAHLKANFGNHDIKLICFIYRRKEKIHTDRWVMSIRFTDPNWIDISAILIAPSDGIEKSLEKKSFKETLAQAQLVFSRVESEPGNRIRKLLKLVEKLPYDKAKELWYYDSWEIQALLNKGKERREKVWKEKDWERWKRHPFAGWPTYSRRGGITNQRLLESLMDSDKSAFESNNWMIKRYASGSNIENDYFQAFWDHFAQLKNDPNHLYSVFKGKSHGIHGRSKE